jgi:hypothetical protein
MYVSDDQGVMSSRVGILYLPHFLNSFVVRCVQILGARSHRWWNLCSTWYFWVLSTDLDSCCLSHGQNFEVSHIFLENFCVPGNATIPKRCDMLAWRFGRGRKLDWRMVVPLCLFLYILFGKCCYIKLTLNTEGYITRNLMICTFHQRALVGRHRRRWVDNIKMDHQEGRGHGLAWAGWG